LLVLVGGCGLVLYVIQFLEHLVFAHKPFLFLLLFFLEFLEFVLEDFLFEFVLSVLNEQLLMLLFYSSDFLFVLFLYFDLFDLVLGQVCPHLCQVLLQTLNGLFVLG
jgi:hypothetical protein